MLYPPNFVIAPGSRRPFLKVFDRSAESAVTVDFSSGFRRLRASVRRTLQPFGPNFFRRFSLLDPQSGPPRPEAGIRSRDDHPCSPVDVRLDAVTQKRRVCGIAVLEEDVPPRTRAPVDTRAVDRQVAEEEHVAGGGRA